MPFSPMAGVRLTFWNRGGELGGAAAVRPESAPRQTPRTARRKAVMRQFTEGLILSLSWDMQSPQVADRDKRACRASMLHLYETPAKGIGFVPVRIGFGGPF